MRRLTLLLAIAALLAGCGGAKKDAGDSAQQGPFAYDSDLPLDPKERVVDRIDGVEVHDVSFAAAGARTQGYLITPKADGPRPAVIFLHGAGGDRKELLPFAARWTAEGGVALTIDAARQGNTANVQEELRSQRAAATQTVVRVRRAIDYLGTLDAVDAEHIGFVGYSAGARSGAIVAGVDRRIDAFVLMSGGATLLQEYVDAAPANIRADVRRDFGAVDPLRWVKSARPNTIFFQNGRQDKIVPRSALEQLRAAAPKPQRFRWYDAGHELNSKAYADQRTWLKERLGLKR